MTKRLLAAILLAVLLVSAAPAAAAPAVRASQPRTVVLVLAPYLRWEDVLSGYMPRLRAMAADEGASADMNVRSLLPNAAQPSADEGALMLSAGTWARYDPSVPAPGDASGTAAIRYPGIAAQRAANSRDTAQIRLGTLGQAIVDAGGVTAAIGDGDGPNASRPAALVAMDAKGDVRLGDVSPALVASAAAGEGPLGRLSDKERILAALATVLAERRHVPGPALVVIDPGDLARAHEAAKGAPEGLAPLARVAALQALDEIVAGVDQGLPRDAVLIVAAPVAAQVAGEPSGFGPLVVKGTGWTGALVSSSTHRPGLVTNADLTATVLDDLGVAVPVQVAGAPVLPVPTAERGNDRLVHLEHIDGFMRAIDAIRPQVVDDFILAVVLLAGLSVALLALARVPRPLAVAVELALLAVLAVPAATVLMFVVLPLPQSPSTVLIVLLASTFTVWTLSVVTHNLPGKPRAMAFLALLTASVITLDQWLGAPLSLDGLLGYSPLVGARFYGLGNEVAALAVGSLATGFALTFDHYASQRWVEPARRWGFPLAAAACVVTAAAPFLGANIGVAVWGTFALGLTWWGMLGRRTTWRTVVVLALVVVIVVAAFAALDTLGAASSRTHLGRAVLTTERGGAAPFVTLLARKAATNVRTLFSTHFSWLFLALAGALAYVRWRPRGSMHDMLVERPSFAAALTGALAGGVIAFFTEDSGIVVPALLLLFPAVAVVYLMLLRRTGEASGE